MIWEFLIYETDVLLRKGPEEGLRGSLVFSGDSPLEATRNALRFAQIRNEKASLGMTGICVYPDGFMGKHCWMLRLSSGGKERISE